jgi:tripartite-type tricarboxylate transporter receptor subunit TctC
MTRDRRYFLRTAAAAIGWPAVAGIASQLVATHEASAQAAPYPDKPIRLVVGFAAGGPADTIARLFGDELAKALGKPLVIENAAGAGGNIATDRVVKSAADGHALLLAASGMIAINPNLYPSLAFDTVRDLAPISQICVQPNVLVVHADLPAASVQELVTLARSQPGQLTFASGGAGSTQHLAGELFKSSARIDIRHVSYRSIAMAVPDLLTGRVTMAFAGSTVALPLVQDGKLRALAVTSLQRSPAIPDLPTMAESGFPGFDATPWFGLMAPAATPSSIVERLHQETVKVLALPGLRKRFEELGMQPIGNSPAQFASAIRAEIPYWAKVIADARIKLTE